LASQPTKPAYRHRNSSTISSPVLLVVNDPG
jgi:hypothetical protein